MFIYIHFLSYYKLFLYFNLCLIVMLDSLVFIYIHSPTLEYIRMIIEETRHAH
jgi:hypothetical protein